MALPDRIYRRKPAGQQILTNPDRTHPLEYQRILALIDQDTHTDVVRGCLRQFPDTLLADWLAEMEEFGYLSSTAADSTQSLDFRELFKAARAAAAPLAAEDRKRIERQTSQAAAALGDKGAFLSLDRIKNREPLGKTLGEISVLIVEDDPDQAAIADMRVSMGGYKVRLAASQKALREELSAGRLPDILLLDIRLPDGDGFEILASMRRHPKLALLPVVMLTVVTGKENVRRGLELGADGYITKPYSKKIVVQTIRDVLKHA
ncbi:MAG: response regulator [Pseudomonadota bacterium]